MGIGAKSRPLAEQEELREAHLRDDVCEVPSSGLDSGGLPLDQVGWPVQVVHAVEFRLEGAEESIVLEPASLLVAKGLEGITQLRRWRRREPLPGNAEKAMLEWDDPFEVNNCGGELLACTVGLSQQALFDQQIRAREQAIAREGGH